MKMWYEIAAPAAAALGLFTAVVWIVRTLVDGRRRKEEVRALADFHSRLLDKLADGREITSFMESEGGHRLLSSFSRERSGTQDRILSAVQAGTVLALVGLALVVLGWLYDFDEDAFTVLGILVGALGAGFLVSSTLSYRLSRKWGLLVPRADGTERSSPGSTGTPWTS